MNLCELKRGDKAVVLKVELPMLLKERLRALRVHSGASITVLKVSVRKGTFLIESGSGKVALGRDVAEGIRIWKT